MKTFRELIVWQKSMNFVTEIYKVSKAFPKEESYGLISQMRRSSVSIPSNISEGFGRDSLNEYIRFLNIAISSLFELQTQIEIAFNLRYIQKKEYKVLLESSREIERMLSSFIRSLKSKR